MNGLAKKFDQAITFQAMGTIVRVEGPILVVRTDDGDFRCRKAVSCLIEPELHDFVLAGVHVNAQKSETAYVLAVLERESPDATVACEGNLDLKVKSGKLRMASAEGIDLVSAKHVQVAATDFSVHAPSRRTR